VTIQTRFGALSLLAILFALTPSASLAKETSMAIISATGKRAPSDQLVALLETSLSEMPEVALVERAKVRAILKEQCLSLSGLVNPKTAIRAGKLLAADLFVFAERLANEKTSTRISVVEARTGINLASFISMEKDPAKELKNIEGRLLRSLAKHRTPAKNRRYVSILGVRNEEMSRTLDPTAAALRALLEHDLRSVPGVTVLDRNHMLWLTKEQNLTGIALALKRSTTLVDAGLRRTPKADGLSLTVILRPMAGGKSTSHMETIPSTKTQAARKSLLSSVLKGLGTNPSDLAPGNSEKEARLFISQALQLGRDGHHDAAASAAEAAMALWPSPYTRLYAARSYYYVDLGIGSKIWVNGRDTGKGAKEQKLHVINARIRRNQIVLEEQLERMRLTDPAKGERLPSSWHMWYASFNPGVIMVRDKGEVLERQKELAELDRKLFALIRTYYTTRFHEQSRDHLMLDLTSKAHHVVQRAVPGNPQTKVQAASDYVEALLKESMTRTRKERIWNEGHVLRIPSNLRAYHPKYIDERKEAWRHADRKAYIALGKKWMEDKRPIVRLTGQRLLLTIGAGTPEMFKAYATDAVTQLGTEQACTAFHGVWNPIKHMKDDHLTIEIYEALLSAWLKRADTARPSGAYNAQHVVMQWAALLMKHKRYAEADALLRQAIKAMGGVKASGAAHSLQSYREEHAKKLGITLKNDPIWSKIHQRRVKIIGNVPFASMVQDDRLYTVAVQADRKHKTVSARLRFYSLPGGGKPLWDKTLKGSLRTEHDKTCTQPSRVLPAVIDGVVYIATDAGLAAFDTKKKTARILTIADGYQGAQVSCMVAFGKRLYIAMSTDFIYGGRCAFASYDPKTGDWQLLGSSNMRKKGPWALNRSIYSMVVDSKRNGIWLSARKGIHRYDPQKNKTKQYVKFMHYSHRPLALCDKGILYSHSQLTCLLDPETGKSSVYLAYSRKDKDSKKQGVYGAWRVRFWPAGMVGDYLITGGYRAGLHTKQGEHGTYRDSGSFWQLIPTRFGLLALNYGEGYLFTAKAQATAPPAK
jgi:hypothetical protein